MTPLGHSLQLANDLQLAIDVIGFSVEQHFAVFLRVISDALIDGY